MTRYTFFPQLKAEIKNLFKNIQLRRRVIGVTIECKDLVYIAIY